MSRKTSHMTQHLVQSGIRAASTRCAAINGINLGQGICDLPVPRLIKEAAQEAIENNKSIYSPCEGIYPLRELIAQKLCRFNQIEADPVSEVVVTHGSTGAFVCAVSTLFDPGDEVVLFEPFYGYHKSILELKGMKVVGVPLSLTDYSIDFDQLKRVMTSHTKGIVICTPCNPLGKVFSRSELLKIGQLAEERGLWVITDEIYEYITYPGHSHVSFASLENFAEFTVTISGFSKTYNMTGWRLGYLAAPPVIARKIALVQDLIYVCPATPLQYAVLAAFHLQEDYYAAMIQSYLQKRDRMVSVLQEHSFRVTVPQGAYYLLADFTQWGFADDVEAAHFFLEKAKVATVPGRHFYSNPQDGKSVLRFCYALDDAKIETALIAIAKLCGATI
jgi:aminotransferase